MEKIAEFDKEIIATVCGSFRRGIGNGLLLSDDCNNSEADPVGWSEWLATPFYNSPYNFQVSLPTRFVSFVCFFFYLSLPCSFSVFHISVDSKI